MSTSPLAEPAATPSGASISWRSADRDDDSAVIEIEEEIDDDVEQLDTTPMKRLWRNSGSRHAEVAPTKRAEDNNNDNGSAGNVNNMNIGSKPKMTNMSLLSSTVALATMERCLLGNLATMREEMGEPTSFGDNKNDDDAAPGFIDYSKQCKPGHVIDLLELRRLASRGVPDEPHEVRTPTPPQPKTFNTNNIPNNNHHIADTTQHFGGMNPHRSYRPLVWRVLLGYLPPQTDQWNEVLARDRKLYATLVNELFESTCPRPHERYSETELKQKREEENHSEATQTNDDEPPPPPTLSETPITPNSNKRIMPGLLSARMQQEWIRDEGDNESKGRISPMCAMNTPKTRSKKTQPLPATLEDESPSTAVGENDTDDQLAGKMKESLILLPDDDNDNAEAGKFTIDDEEDVATKDTAETSDTEEQQGIIDKNKITRSVSITKTSEVGVETHIPLTPYEQADRDEEAEEDLQLLDEIRKDVIRTHPDLRFFLEPEEDLGQKRYAALERILYVWAKLNRGVSFESEAWEGDCGRRLFLVDCFKNVEYVAHHVTFFTGSLCSGDE